MGAWSSSGVIESIVEYDMFDYDIYNATNKSEGCPENINATIKYIDDVFDKYLDEGKEKE